jgi:hypothetical protein
MPALSISSTIMWVASPTLQLLCVFLLWRHKLLQQFSFLASYLVFLTAKNVVLYAAFRTAGEQSWTYFWLYWVGMAMADMAKIAVLYEIFCAAFKPFAGLQDLSRVAFKWAATSILVVGLLVAGGPASTTATAKLLWIMSSINNFERIVRVMECALLLFLFMGSQHLGVSKRNRVFGFALGFGVDAFCQLVVYTMLPLTHISKTPLMAQLLPAAYCVSLTIWTVYLLQPQPQQQSLHIPVSSPLLRWNEVALALGHSGGQVAINEPEAFMPSVERMVEQVMQKELTVDRRAQRYVV